MVGVYFPADRASGATGYVRSVCRRRNVQLLLMPTLQIQYAHNCPFFFSLWWTYQASGSDETLRQLYLVLRVSLLDASGVEHPACFSQRGPFFSDTVYLCTVLVLACLVYASMLGHWRKGAAEH